MNNERYFLVFTNCVVIRGVNRGMILDIHKNFYLTIPDSMCDVIENLKSKQSVEQLYKIFGEENKSVIDEYISFLETNDFGSYINSGEFDSFIEMDFGFEFPSIISNCVIEISKTTKNEMPSILKKLDDLHCKYVQLVAYDYLPIKTLTTILDYTREFDLSIELVVKDSKQKNKKIYDYCLKYNVSSLIFHSSEKNYEIIENEKILVTYLSSKVTSFIYCGSINRFYFNINKNKALESINHNSCLHKKISIDKDGNIKNCPAMPQSFGNIKDTTLEEALNHPDFKKYWNITKDMIQVCKDCEFRHICTDCRAYTERTHFEGDIDLSKPLKCGYNPYTNEWTEWSTNPLKHKAIEYYGMQELVKNG